MAALPTPPDERRTLAMVRRMQAGDDAAWRELYERYRDELVLSIRLQMGAKLRAALQTEDVLQSVVLDAFRALPEFEDRGKGSFLGFLKTVLLSKLRSHGRRLGAQKRRGTAALDSCVADGLAAPAPAPTYRDPRYDRLEQALRRLPPDMRAIIVLRRIDGLSNSEAAARLERSDEAARKLYSRAIARLTLMMADQPGER